MFKVGNNGCILDKKIDVKEGKYFDCWLEGAVERDDYVGPSSEEY